MFNALRVNNQTQYAVNRRLQKKNEENLTQKATVEAEGEGQNNNLAQSRGLKYVENLQNGTATPKPIIVKQSFNPLNNVQISKNRQLAKPKQSEEVAEVKTVENVSSNINIAQIMNDFKKTSNAIGTPDDVFNEVKGYLDLIDIQVQKNEPNIKLIQTNLRNAAGLLDSYISNTLNKTSKVVQNWIEAIFLQKVDYKYNEGDVNKAFLVQMPEDKKQTKPSDEINSSTSQIQTKKIDDTLKTLFSQAKKFMGENKDTEAIDFFNQAISRAVEVKDFTIQSKVYLEVGKVYDKNDDLPKALDNYNKALQITDDNNVKVQAHYSMGQIYDDVKKFEPAIEHYMATISYAGETNNLKAQTQALTRIGNIFADKYDKNAFTVFEDAKNVAKETNNAKVKGYVSSNIANAYNKFNKPTDALKYYSDAVKNYKEADVPTKVAVNYKRAAELMQDYDSPQKAKSLLQKAISFAIKAKETSLIEELNKELQVA